MSEFASLGISLAALVVTILTFAFADNINKTARFIVGAIGILVSVIFGALGLSTLSPFQPVRSPTSLTAIADMTVEATKSVKSLKIEAIPSQVSAFIAVSDNFVTATMPSSVLEIINGDSTGLVYKHQYSFPETGKGYAGTKFEFDNSQDLSDYQAIRFSMFFDTNLLSCELYLADSAGKIASVPCRSPFAKNSEVTVLQGKDGRHTSTVPLRNNFGVVDLAKVKKVYTVIGRNTSAGIITIRLSNIEFIKS